MVKINFEKHKNVHKKQAASQLKHNPWTMKYNQKDIYVKTKEMIGRSRSLINSLQISRYLFGTLNNGIPDLFGSAWIIVSLMATIDIHIKLVAQLPVKSGMFFGYDFTPVYILVVAVICFVWIAPLALLALIRRTLDDGHFSEEENHRSVLSLLVLYAFTLSTYSQFPLVWIMSIYWLQWFKTLSSTLISAGAVIIWLRPYIDKSKYANMIIGLILVLYTLEAAVFMVFVFDRPMIPVSVKNVSSTAPIDTFMPNHFSF